MRSPQNEKKHGFRFRILRDPLVHFLGLGFVLYIGLSALSSQKDMNVITVDEAVLLTYMQYNSRAFDQKAARQTYNALSAEAHARLVQNYIQEEALYREAKKLGLEQGDFIIRQRMVQKFDYMAEAAIAFPTPSVEKLKAFYSENLADFSAPARASFTHLFFKTDKTSNQGERAIVALAKIKAITTSEALQQYGDPFAYQQTYTHRTKAQISEFFGAGFADLIMKNGTNLQEWIGPVSSPHGLHLLYITQKHDAYIEPFETVKDVITERMRRAEIARHKAAYVDAIIANYTLELIVTPPNDDKNK